MSSNLNLSTATSSLSTATFSLSTATSSLSTSTFSLKPLNEFTFLLKINGEHNMYLYSSIKKMIRSSHFDYETNSIFFSAEKVLSFKQYLLEEKRKKLSHNICIKLIDDLTKQIIYLKTLGFSFYGFDIDDILTIDETFIFCSTKYLLPLENDNIIFMSPIKQPYFSNPEVFKLTSLPSEISYKCCFYSLGSIVVFSLLNTYLLVANELKTSEQIDKILEPLYNTKIYWFLKRCLEENINNRALLLI